MATLAGVLADLAEEGTLHGDIKPDNPFWYNDGPVLGDFGIAASADARPGQIRVGGKLGTANFIAPEMRERRSGAKADVYLLSRPSTAGPARRPARPGP
ncbi:hypothetical protein FGD71_012200 [Streptomyces sporangiiformans]|uniref:Protein kinase domain-containing protein n=1 Tax=Streptomyces sporangiiformans TaxID=2315329 RepID=A0A505DBT9_9ACTN|nr:hypothetical protein FGD71_012200 [Streptomyces sporangiiformans]